MSSVTSSAITSKRATLVGLAAVLIWSFLSLLTVASGRVPPFQLTALAFTIGGGIGAIGWLVRGGASTALRQPPAVWLLGIVGLFGYHALYFVALRLAPPAEAQLVNYLWPLLIVLFAAFLPGERLRAHHIVGVLLGLAGTAVLFVARGGITFAQAYRPGFAAALLAAVAWAVYSVLSRRFATVPTSTVAGFCLATAALSSLCHLLFEETHWPEDATQWLAIVALGVGPVGIAFYAWDIGVKRGDIRVLGAASYAAPLLSTAYLVLAGYAAASASLALAAALITVGGLIAAKDMFIPARKS
jgi:drug/metabolite transporter (DMT)-like permease